MEDISVFTRGMYSQDALPIKYVGKSPDQMPPDDPFASYQGRSGSPPKEIIWVSTPAQGSVLESEPAPSSSESEPIRNNLTDAYVAATTLALMDAGRAGPTLQALYARTPFNRSARLDLGISVARAFDAAGDQAGEFAASQASWIKAHVSIGATRSDAYALLKSQGLVAYNMAYVKVRAEAVERSSPGTVVVRCDDSIDRSSANWPYRNEPLPKVEEVHVRIFSGK